ncbi:MAG: Gfo/Idh/MocA family oxidoreductase [Candidatus Lokiarchaeota archaeon]|nr:Gfo/Idh/MocA family oxidoreductase [Candidatus Lokiarchaeota archaeon]
MKNFALTGLGGYIAPRHLQAIKDTNNNLIATCDPNDSVGIIDRYFPNAAFFTQFERFDRHLEMLRRRTDGNAVEYLSICSPNFLHDAHIRLALRVGADAICEKPLVLNPWNLDNLEKLEEEFGKKVHTILQLRVHDSLIQLKNNLQINKNKKKQIELTYITSRGLWYNYSWKGDIQKSGGVATNIGVHFFDMLIWLFGKPIYSELYLSEPNKMSGFIELENAEVSWYLSLEAADLPASVKESGKPTYRLITIDGEEIQFSDGFTDLHTKVYENILNGSNEFGIQQVRPSIELVYQIRNAKIIEKPYKGKLHKNLIKK